MSKQITTVIIGLGGRGKDTYAEYIRQNPDKMKIVAIADIEPEKVDRVSKAFNIPREMCFESADDLLKEEKLADTALICTQDRDHVEEALVALERGYHLLLEKPISPELEECKQLLAAAKKYNKHVIVCHVLRYTPFYETIKAMITEGKIGEVVTIQAIENVAYWHQAHSFVRGNWRRSDETSPMILAKCCHDMDILLWLADKRCKKVSSFGSTYLFKEEKAPEGAAMRCMDGCKCQDECPYDAVKCYIDDPKMGIKHGNTGWPVNIVALDPTLEKVTEALKEGPYGRCVYHCDNDVVDHQVVNLELEEGVTINFTMSAFTGRCYRYLKIMGTQGCIEGHMDKNLVVYEPFGGEKVEIDITKLGESLAGHGGGDYRMMDRFIELMQNPEANKSMGTTIERSIESHVVALLAEESRINGGKCLSLE
ncbi:Gfo/Idh/MocA family oxidoreductase [Zhenhengia yiwuensis]|uniref:Gfo/Idh/MocA family protein n=1 Tax=Zhenhengia yiwuensis TaxID=2763666 RepID=UPI002A74A190|nr:Gfo/Idh/MocA family oxidoreductase [Zhenhengia yiwuensis]MDY3366793.1 Gfo/Idh/MocA family oxidoreductase [Zhenhengia yiwuensis]